jgi:hypothetical protein
MTIQNSPNSSSMSRRRLLRNGLFTGLGAGMAAAGLVTGTQTRAYADIPLPIQDWWRWCANCDGLFHSAAQNGYGGVCWATKTGGPHYGVNSYRYTLRWSDMGRIQESDVQDNWRWCSLCQLLAFAGNGTSGACPARNGGGHSLTSSYNYVLWIQGAVISWPQQDGWSWCGKCQGLYFGSFRADSSCAVSANATHTLTPSYDYLMVYDR